MSGNEPLNTPGFAIVLAGLSVGTAIVLCCLFWMLFEILICGGPCW